MLDDVLYAGGIFPRNRVLRVNDKYAPDLRKGLFIFPLHDQLARSLEVEQLQSFKLLLDIAGIRGMAGRRISVPGWRRRARCNLSRLPSGKIRDLSSILSLIIADRTFDDPLHRFHEFMPPAFSEVVGLREGEERVELTFQRGEINIPGVGRAGSLKGIERLCILAGVGLLVDIAKPLFD
jgi:hypothetical protein